MMRSGAQPLVMVSNRLITRMPATTTQKSALGGFFFRASYNLITPIMIRPKMIPYTGIIVNTLCQQSTFFSVEEIGTIKF
jgi:hypothetical protein